MSLSYSNAVSVSRAERARLLEFALATVAEAGQAVLPYFRNDPATSNKAAPGHFDPVTEADEAAERLIRSRIQEAWPAHGIFGEEEGHVDGNGLTWVIDPIDGTRAFLTGMLHWGMLLALFDGETPVLGLMHQPFTNEFFYGDNDEAWYRRGDVKQQLQVRPCASLSHAMLATTSPELFDPGHERDAFQQLWDRARLTRFGGDCYLYALLAMGQLDLVVESNLKPFDIQALVPIVRGAGGLLTTWQGDDPSLGGRIVAAGDARLHAEVCRILAE